MSKCIAFTLQPNDVETALAESPKEEKSLAKELVKWIRGLSSATTHKVLTHDKFTPRFLRAIIAPPSPLVHSSITP